MRKWKKVERFGEYFAFDKPGIFLEGVLKGIRERIATEYGIADFLELETDDGLKTVVITAGLKSYNWEELQGQYIKIEYEGDERNSKTKRTFKKFNVYVEEPKDVPF